MDGNKTKRNIEEAVYPELKAARPHINCVLQNEDGGVTAASFV
jgi:hypothetical protein